MLGVKQKLHGRNRKMCVCLMLVFTEIKLNESARKKAKIP